MSALSKRLEVTMEKYAPEGFDPASDDMTIPFAMQLVERDAELARMRAVVEAAQQWRRGGLSARRLLDAVDAYEHSMLSLTKGT